MKGLIKIIMLCAFSYTLNAQSYFNKLYDYDGLATYNNAAASVYELSNGDYLVSGQKFYSFAFGSLFFIRINSMGDTISAKRYPKNNCIYYGGASGSLVKCFDGNLVQSGTYYDSIGNADALLVKLTENGDTLWTKTYGGGNPDNANIVCQTPDSGFVLMGATQSFSMGAASDFYLIKTDKNGVQQWQQVYGTTASEDCVSGQITLDGGYVMSGHKSNELHIVKTDATGGFEWQQTYTGTKNLGFIKQLADSTYILTGAKTVSGFGDQAYMMKLNKLGGIIWQKDYGTTTNDIFYTQPVILSDGSIVVGGRTMLGSIPIGMLIKTDSAGNQQWLRTYYANTLIDNYVYDLKQTADGGFIIVGTGYITSQDAWVVKVDSNGCEVANCNVSVEEFQLADSRLNVYPNPSSNEIHISIDGENLDNYEIIITNILGKKQSIENNSSEVNISELISGIYFISATSIDGKQRFIEKFVKE